MAPMIMQAMMAAEVLMVEATQEEIELKRLRYRRWAWKGARECAIVLGLLIASLLTSNAQPLFKSIHDWTIKTPLGQIGYKEWQMIPSEFHYRCIVLGPFGR